MPGRAPCLLTLPEAVGGALGLGSAVEAFVGPHLCDLQYYLGQVQQECWYWVPYPLCWHPLSPAQGDTRVSTCSSCSHLRDQG